MTYTNGADRVSRLLEDQVRQAIADRERTDRIVSMSIMLDASKKNVDLIAKNLVMLRANGDQATQTSGRACVGRSPGDGCHVGVREEGEGGL
jgi:hypothetical protein